LKSQDQEGQIPYTLPKKTLAISATYVLKGCKTAIDTKNRQVLDLGVSTNVTLVALNEADESERYLIPYVKLRSSLKETNFVVESHGNGTLKSFSTSINDQSAAVISSAANLAIKTVGLLAAGASASELYCKAETVTDLQAVAANKGAIEQIRTRMNPDGTPVAKLSPADEYRIAKLQSEIDNIISDKLTTKVVLMWSPTLQELKPWYAERDAATRTLAPDLAVSKWLTPQGGQWLAANRDPSNSIVISISVPVWAHAPVPAAPAAFPTTEQHIDGFVVRDPALSNVLVCMGVCPIPQDGLMSVDTVATTADAAIPQFGRRLVLPLHNSFGQNSVLDISMSEDGMISKLGQRSTSTIAAGVTALGTAVDAEKSREDARAKAKRDALTAEQNQPRDDNKRLADCLAAQKVILDNGGTPIGVCR